MSDKKQPKKHIIFGISSSIALYKSIEIIKKLQDEKIKISCILTKNSLKLIELKDFKEICDTYTETFRDNFDYKDYIKNNKEIEHINLADSADLMVIIPATANIIGKIANGICDDLLSTTFLTCNCQKIIAPAMNCKMWDNSILQKNISKLKHHNISIIEPDYGELACGYKGKGRLQKIDIIIKNILKNLKKKDDFKNKKILITAGPTHEEIDPVRYISNKSSGKMGYSIAKAAQLRGANVTLISGPTNLNPPQNVRNIDINSAEEMQKEVMKNSDCDIFISAAAVADYKVKKSQEKIKKKDFINLKLEKNPDIVYEFSKINKDKKIVIGFALETNNLIENAKDKLNRKNLDFIVANSTTAFGSDLNTVTIIDKISIEKYEKQTKFDIANRILDKILKLPKFT